MQTQTELPKKKDLLLTLQELSERTSVQYPTLLKMAKEGAFRAVRMGKGYRVRESSFDKWMDETFG